MGVTNSRSAFILYSNVSVPRDSQSPALEAHTRSTITLIGSRARGCVGNAVGTSRNSAAVAACLQPTEAQITQFDPTASLLEQTEILGHETKGGHTRVKARCRSVISLIILTLVLAPFGSVASAQSVAFINPGKSDETYWVTATQGMQAAADNLGMTLEVQYAEREPVKTLVIAREMIARPAGKRPEYFVITDDSAVADQLLKIIDAGGAKSFLAYSSIPMHQRVGTGSPRGKYKGWLGSLEPRAEGAGYLTAHRLIERGKREEAFGSDGKIHMLAIAGDRSTSSSINRNEGMHRAIAEDPSVILDQEVYAAWARANASTKADQLYRLYPDAKLIWAGNDLMGLGAMTAWVNRGGKPGVDAWFSGINTSSEALEGVKSGRLTSLAGGHFITGAWSLVMIYDYHHGRDFADEGLELQKPMFAEFTPQVAERYIERFSGGFGGIDFSRYSKVKNPQLKRYNFGFGQLLELQP